MEKLAAHDEQQRRKEKVQGEDHTPAILLSLFQLRNGHYQHEGQYDKEEG